MKRIIPVWLLLSIGIVLLLVGGNKIVSTRNDIIFEEETLIGNVSVYDGISIDMISQDNDFKYNILLDFQQGLMSHSDFIAQYYKKERYKITPRVTLEANIVDEIYERERINYNQPGVYRYKVKDYYTYMLLQLSWHMDKTFMVTKNEQSEFLQITIPEDAELVVENEGNGSTSITQNKLPTFSSDLPFVHVGNEVYYTITNLELENRAYFDSEISEVEYRGVSGIFRLDTNQNKFLGASIDDMTRVLYPIEIGSDRDNIVLDLSKVTKKEFLALTVLEKQDIFLYVYDTIEATVISKEKVGELPKNARMINFGYVEQEDYLLANYSYEVSKTEQSDSNETVYAVYQVSEEGNVKVKLEQQYASKASELISNLTLDNLEDMYYQKDLLYLMFRSYQNYTSIELLAIDANGLRYAGRIKNSMFEDSSIGSSNYNIKHHTDYGQRYISEMYFRR